MLDEDLLVFLNGVKAIHLLCVAQEKMDFFGRGGGHLMNVA
jgi:hypothetical protein